MSLDPAIKKLETSNLTRRRALGIYQIFGGVVGIVMVLTIFLSALSEGSFLIPTFFILLLYCFSVVCGILLLGKKENGLTLSLINQAAQTIAFNFGSFGWMYFSGLHLSMGISITDSGFWHMGWGLIGFNIFLGGETQFQEFLINVVAAGLIYYIILLRRNIQKEIILKNTEEIAEQLTA
ncbi:MAG: hypothetical protein WCF67_15690 [Chitinophagaceae bacterium]